MYIIWGLGHLQIIDWGDMIRLYLGYIEVYVKWKYLGYRGIEYKSTLGHNVEVYANTCQMSTYHL